MALVTFDGICNQVPNNFVYMDSAHHRPPHLDSMVVEFLVGLFLLISDALNFVAFISMFLYFSVYGLLFTLPRHPLLYGNIIFSFDHVFEIIIFSYDAFLVDVFTFSFLFFPIPFSPSPVLTSGVLGFGGGLGILGRGEAKKQNAIVLWTI